MGLPLLLGLWLTLAAAAAGQPLAAGPTLSPRLDNPDACSEGVVRDDSTVETGYSWIPSVEDGRYLQLHKAEDFPGGAVGKVCICWFRTRIDEDIDFRIVLYEADERRKIPAPSARFSVPASASAVPSGITGRFYEYTLPTPLQIPERDFYLGVEWDASVDQFIFICGDLGGFRRPVPTYFSFTQGKHWISALQTTDPIFDEFKTLMIRPVSTPPQPAEIQRKPRER